MAVQRAGRVVGRRWRTAASTATMRIDKIMLRIFSSPVILYLFSSCVDAAALGICEVSQAESRNTEQPAWNDFQRNGGSCHASLTSVFVEVEISGPFAKVLANYTYSNDGSHRIRDAVVFFDWPLGAVLTGFSAQGASDSSRVEGRLESKRAGKVPAVCPRPSIGFGFMDIAAMQKNNRVPIGSIGLLETVSFQLEYVLKMSAMRTSTGVDAWHLTITAPYGSRKTSKATPARLENPMRISVASASGRPVSLTTSTARASVLQPQSAANSSEVESPLIQDVSVNIILDESVGNDGRNKTVEDSFAPTLITQRQPDTGLVVAALTLPLARPAPLLVTYEFVLVVDRQFNENPKRLEKLQAAALSFVKNVPNGSLVNLIGFGAGRASSTALFVDASREINSTNYALIEDYIRGSVEDDVDDVPASMNGEREENRVTDSLVTAFEKLARKKRMQLRLLLLTERHPPDSEGAIRYIEGHCGRNCQLSAIGIGWGASPQFVEGLSTTAKGISSFVADRGGVDALDRAVVSHMEDAMLPIVQETHVDWSDFVQTSKDGNFGVSFAPLTESEKKTGNRRPLVDEDEVRSFVFQGGIREVYPVVIEPPAISKGDRLLGFAFLGEWLRNRSAEVRVSIVVSGVNHTVSVQAKVDPLEGWGLHAYGAHLLSKSLAETQNGNGQKSYPSDQDVALSQTKEEIEASAKISRASADQVKLQAIGLTYKVINSETHWVADMGEASSSTSSVEFSPTKPGLNRCVTSVAADRNSIMDPDNVISDVRGSSIENLYPSVSCRRPLDGVGSSKTTSRGATLSLIDVESLGSKLSLRVPSVSAFPGKAKAKPKASPAPKKDSGETISMRNRTPLSSMMSLTDFQTLGGGISLATTRKTIDSYSLQSDYKSSKNVGENRFVGTPRPSNQQKPEVPDLRIGQEADPSTTLRTRETRCLGSTISIIATDRLVPQNSWEHEELSKKLSIFDFINVGSSLSVRPLERFGMDERGFGKDYFDFDSLGGRRGSDFGARHSGGEKPKKATDTTSLAMRSNTRLSSKLIGSRISTPNLSLLDVVAMGSAMSLRPPKRGSTADAGLDNAGFNNFGDYWRDEF